MIYESKVNVQGEEAVCIWRAIAEIEHGKVVDILYQIDEILPSRLGDDVRLLIEDVMRLESHYVGLPEAQLHEALKKRCAQVNLTFDYAM